MLERCVVLFPEFTNIDIINWIRDKYDPLSAFIKPHITLVFPFVSGLASDEIATHVQNAAKSFAPFNLTMKGFTASIEAEETYIFLNITEGLQEVYRLSKSLYTGILDEHQSEQYKNSYLPHITVGRIGKDADYQSILVDIGHVETTFTALIDSIYVEITNYDDSSVTEMIVNL